jgi:DNA primase
MTTRIPQEFIDELIERVDIVEVIDSRVSLKKAGRNYSARCPFHNENTPSFTVSQDKQFYHCFGCGAHGTVISFLMQYESLGFIEAVEALAQQAGLTMPAVAHQNKPASQGVYEVLAKAVDYFSDRLRTAPDAQAYLKKRGLAEATVARFGLGYAPESWDGLMHQFSRDKATVELLDRAGLVVASQNKPGNYYDRFRHRIMFPIRDPRGRTIGFGGRVLGNDTPKYLNSPETSIFHKGREVYGLYEARKTTSNLTKLLVVEGYMDVIALAEHGVPYAVATLGTSITPEHIRKLFKIVPEIIFCFDGDQAGRQAGFRALEHTLPELRDGHHARFLYLPEGQDPDSMIRAEGKVAFEARVVAAAPLSEVLLNHLRQQADMNSMDGRARFLELARPYLQRLPEGSFRLLFLDQLAQAAQVEVRKLTALLDGRKSATSLTAAPHRSVPQLRMTPMRKLIAMLLHKPALASRLDDVGELSQIEAEGSELFQEMVELARLRPNLTTASLIEHWRHSDISEHLLRLAEVDLGLPPEAYESEFDDGIKHLCAKLNERKLDHLLNKSAHTPLTEQEKNELRNLLAARHGK